MHSGRVTAHASLTSGKRNMTRERRQTDRSVDSWSRTTKSFVTKPNVRETRKFGLVFEHLSHLIFEHLSHLIVHNIDCVHAGLNCSVYRMLASTFHGSCSYSLLCDFRVFYY